jgi:hypothetical protein
VTTTFRPRDDRGHYLASKDVHTTLEPDAWDDTCRHQVTASEVRRCEQCGREGTRFFTTLAAPGVAPITVCTAKAACRKRRPKPPRDDD